MPLIKDVQSLQSNDFLWQTLKGVAKRKGLVDKSPPTFSQWFKPQACEGQSVR